MSAKSISFVVGVLFLAHAALAQTTWHVKSGGTPPGAGTASNPFVFIQDAVNAASPGDTVLVRPGNYIENIDFSGKDLTLRSTGGAAATTIDGGGGFMCVRFVNGETAAALLRGFTLTNGASIDGAGILCVQTSPRIEDCVITGNTAINDGGGIHCFNAAPAIARCTIRGNASGYQGGGVASVSGASPTLSECTVAANTTGTYGGGIAVNAGSILVADSTVESNTVSAGDGGGVYALNPVLATLRRTVLRANVGGFGGAFSNTGGTVVIEDSELLANTSIASGGGLSLAFGTVDLRNTVIAANVSGGFGGAIYTTSSTTTIVNCTVRNNASALGGGGIAAGFGPNVAMANSILWGNTPDQANAVFAAATVVASYSDIAGGYPGAGNINADPQHVDPTGFDFNLLAASPCVNAGSNAAAVSLVADHDGRPRVVGASVDIGAFEYAPLLSGSADDLALATAVDGHGAVTTIHAAAPGALMRIELTSPLGSFFGSAPLVAAEIYPAGAPPVGPLGFPEVHLSLAGAQIVFDGGSAGIFGPTLLGPAPIVLTSTVPTGFGGFIGRLQGLVVTPFAANGFFAITDVHEFVF